MALSFPHEHIIVDSASEDETLNAVHADKICALAEILDLNSTVPRYISDLLLSEERQMKIAICKDTFANNRGADIAVKNLAVGLKDSAWL